MKVRNHVVVLHILLHGADDEVNEQLIVEVFSFGKSTGVDGDDGLAELVSANVVDEFSLGEILSYGIFIDIRRLELLFIVIGVQVRKIGSRPHRTLHLNKITRYKAIIVEQNLTAIVQFRRNLCQLAVVKLEVWLVIMEVGETWMWIVGLEWQRRT